MNSIIELIDNLIKSMEVDYMENNISLLHIEDLEYVKVRLVRLYE